MSPGEAERRPVGDQAAHEQVADLGPTVTDPSDIAQETPPFQVMPPLSVDELASLRDDIAENGVRVPIDVDQHGRILDGHHRAQICGELGITVTARTVVITNDEAGRQHALMCNTARRHLTRDQRRMVVTRALLADPHLSDRIHATRCGVSPTTVGTVRASLTASGELSNLDSRTGADGRTRPAARSAAEIAELELARHKAREAIHSMELAFFESGLEAREGGERGLLFRALLGVLVDDMERQMPDTSPQLRELIRAHLDAVADTLVSEEVAAIYARYWPLTRESVTS